MDWQLYLQQAEERRAQGVKLISLCLVRLAAKPRSGFNTYAMTSRYHPALCTDGTLIHGACISTIKESP